jgi:hypothetical protein
MAVPQQVRRFPKRMGAMRLQRFSALPFLALLLTPLPARAGCLILTAKSVMADKAIPLVFSGTVTEVARSGRTGYRATFKVDHVWKGSVSERINVYVWELAGEMPTFEKGERHVVLAHLLTDPRMREKLGLGPTVTEAFTPAVCSGGAPSVIRAQLGPGYEPAKAAGAGRLDAGRLAGQPPDDFAVKVDFEGCGPNMATTLDTYRHVYTRQMGVGGKSPISIPLTLRVEQMAAVHDALGSIGFSDYPTKFQGASPTAAGEIKMVQPSDTYRLEVRSGGVVHSVTWNDDSFPHSEEATRLLRVLKTIERFINERPEVKRLPPRKAACM